MGFTLLEVLVVIIIIGVLFAIAAPGWAALMNRQRVNSVRDQASQIIRQAQSDARRTKLAKVVVFDNSTGVPRAATLSRPLDPNTGTTAGLLATADVAAINNWQTLGNGDIAPNSLGFAVLPTAAQNQLIFNSNGAIDDVSAAVAPPPNANGDTYMLSVNVQQANTSAATTRCVIVTTLLGATRTTDSGNCPT